MVESYDATLGQLPEGVAVAPDGDIYVTLAGSGELRRVDGKTYQGETVAQFDVGAGFLLGMAFDQDELYVVLGSFVPETSGVWHVDEDGSIERVVDIQGFPNDVTFDADGNMYVTESISGSVFKVDAGSTTAALWFQSPLLVGDVEVSPVPFPIGANGIVYDDETHSVLVVNSQVPRLVEIDDDDGAAGAVSVIAAGEHLRGADGIALDRHGDVYLVANARSTVSRIDRQSGEATILADENDGLVFPSTIAFGRRGHDKKAAFIANFGFGAGPDAPVGLLRLEVGEKGEAIP
ncbi:MAG: hypothetical protein KC457_09860 [Myxococcales bacterium]|nr:hypothetical protein [Myxococcales bacterium]